MANKSLKCITIGKSHAHFLANVTLFSYEKTFLIHKSTLVYEYFTKRLNKLM